MENHHFLSYSDSDGSEIAWRLYGDLVGLEPPVPVWIDQREILGGENWQKSIREALEATWSLILIMTPNSVVEESGSSKEFHAAQELRRTVFPLRFYPGLRAPMWLGPLQEISFVEDDPARWQDPNRPWSERSWRTAVDKLRSRLLHLQSQQPPSDALESTLPRLESQLERLQKTLIKERDKAKRAEIQDRIDYVNGRLDELLGPSASVDPRGIEAQLRQPQTPPPSSQDRGIYVNGPPASVPSYFQGRDEETQRLVQFLGNDVQRLLMVKGRGGIGKTALVCHLLESLTDEDASADRHDLSIDGVVYVSIDGAHRLTAQSLVEDLARSLPPESAERYQRGLEEIEAQSSSSGLSISTQRRVGALLDELPGGCRILFLDNFEDLVDDHSHIRNREIADILITILTHRRQHGLKVVLTTRVAPREIQQTEPARQELLELPEGLSSPYAEKVLRAMDPDDTVKLASAPEELLREAQKRTGGHPRALEVILGSLMADRHLSLSDLLSKLLPEAVYKVLIGDTFKHFDPLTQQVMQALAIYGRSVSSVAVDFLIQPYVPGLSSSEPILHRLVNLMFVRKQGRQYSLHRVDQQYVLHSIPPGNPRGEGEERPFTRLELQLLAADYCKAMRKEPQLIASVNDLEPQLAEIELRHAAGDVEDATQVLLSIDDRYLRAWAEYQTIVDLHQRLVGDLDDAFLKTLSYESLTKAYTSLGKTQEASDYIELAKALAEEMDNPQEQARLRLLDGNLSSSVGNTQAALRDYDLALRMAERIGDLALQAKCLTNIGGAYLDLGVPDEALKKQEAALAIARELSGFTEEAAFMAGNAALALLELGRYPEAIELAEEGLDGARATDHRRIASYCEYAAALGWLQQAEWSSSAMAIRRAQQKAVAENAPDIFSLAGLISLHFGEQTEARQAFLEANRRAETLLDFNSQNHTALDARALALSGLVLCEGAAHLSGAAADSYKAAREVNRDRGVVQRALRLFEALSEHDPTGQLTEVRAALT